MKKEKKKEITLGFIVLGVLVLILAVYLIYVRVTTTPEEEAYNAAVREIVELSDNKKNQSEEETSKSYIEELAKEEEKEAQPYFDKYREEYVSKEKDGYLVELPVQEMLNYEIVREYTYEVHVQEKDGEYIVTSMERKNTED